MFDSEVRNASQARTADREPVGAVITHTTWTESDIVIFFKKGVTEELHTNLLYFKYLQLVQKYHNS